MIASATLAITFVRSTALAAVVVGAVVLILVGTSLPRMMRRTNRVRS